MNEADKLRQQRVDMPGSEKFTRPEEIKALSKYLSAIRETRDESLDLESQLLGVPGRTTGKIPEINSLGDKIIGTPENQNGELPGLSSKILGVSGNSDTGEINHTEPKVTVLPEKILGLEDLRELGLSEKLEKLEGTKEIDSLRDKLLTLQDERENSLSEKRLDLEDERNNSLSEKRLDLEDTRSNNLETKRLDLEDTRNQTLEDKRLDLTDERTQGLETKRLDLEDTKNPELSKKRLDLSDIQEPELSEKRLDLEDTRNQTLEDKRLDLEDDREQTLSSKRLDLEEAQEVQLENKRLDLSDIETPELSDKKLGLYDDRNQELGNKKLEISDDRNTELSSKRLDLTDNSEPELSKKRLDISDVPEATLEDKKLKIHDTRTQELENKKLEISDDRDLGLEDKRLDLNDLNNPELSKKRLDLHDDSENSLSTKRLDLSGIETQELSDKRLDLSDTRDPELSDKILSLEGNDPEITDLPTSITDTEENSEGRVMLEDGRDIEIKTDLSEIDSETPGRLKLTDDTEVGIDKTLAETEDHSAGRIMLTDSRDIELDENIDDTEEHSQGRIKFTDLREYNLDKTLDDSENHSRGRIKLTDVWNLSELDDTIDDTEDHSKGRVKLDDSRELEIDKTLDELGREDIKISDTREIEELRGEIVDLGKLEDTREDPEIIKTLEEAEENSRGKVLIDDTREEIVLGKSLEDIENDVTLINENPNGEVEELHNSLIAQVENINGTPEELYNSLIEMASDYSKWSSLEEKDYATLRTLTSKLSDDDLYNVAITMASAGEKGSGNASSWFSKVASQMSSYLSSAEVSSERLKGFVEAAENNSEMAIAGAKALEMGPNNNSDVSALGNKKVDMMYNTSDRKGDSIWAKAAEATNGMKGITRRDAIDKMIVSMLDDGKRKKDLPGNLVDVKGLVGNVVSIITGEAEHPNPINHPLSVAGVKLPGGPGDAFYQPANARISFNGPPDIPVFYNSYWSSESFKSTLYDLCPGAGAAPVVSLMELKTILEGSPFITTPGRFSTVTKGLYKAQTLDTNMYWEITIDPYCALRSDEKQGNGNWSYLPSIKEINVENKKLHDVTTHYGSWAPIIGFELQKTKLNTKSVPLFNGELQFPDGLEFTNELRITIADDSWKSWRRYFEKCAKVAVYNSKPHDTNFYLSPTPELTEIDETLMLIAYYKNITFEITVYILNPQFNTLKKYVLLCVLKDFSEEYVGEIDAGGTDLTVTFSIVGENPIVNPVSAIGYFERVTEQTVDTIIVAASEAQKLAVGAIKNSIGLL